LGAVQWGKGDEKTYHPQKRDAGCHGPLVIACDETLGVCFVPATSSHHDHAARPVLASTARQSGKQAWREAALVFSPAAPRHLLPGTATP
jgi:hypothetical protein